MEYNFDKDTNRKETNSFYWILAVVLGYVQKKIERKVNTAYQK